MFLFFPLVIKSGMIDMKKGSEPEHIWLFERERRGKHSYCHVSYLCQDRNKAQQASCCSKVGLNSTFVHQDCVHWCRPWESPLIDGHTFIYPLGLGKKKDPFLFSSLTFSFSFHSLLFILLLLSPLTQDYIYSQRTLFISFVPVLIH